MPIPLSATGTTEIDERLQVERVQVEVHTAPNARVECTPPGNQMATQTQADAQGDATCTHVVSGTDAETVVVVSAMGTERGQRGATITVHVARPLRLVGSDVEDAYHCQPRSCTILISADRIVFRGLADAHAEAGGVAATPTLGSDGFPSTSDFAAPIDVLARALTAPPSELFSAHEVQRYSTVEIPVVIVWADGTRLEQSVGVPWNALRDAVGAELARGRTEAVALAAEGTGHALLVVNDPPSYGLHGDAPTVGDIGLLAFTEDATRDASCGRYEGPSGEVVTIVRHMHDRRVLVFDRRTGREVGRHVFRAPELQCAASTGQVVPESFVEPAEVTAWLDRVAQTGTVR